MSNTASWLNRQILVVVGTGGVGKTTTASAIGLEAARRGKRVLVLTIDPAQRLADALGVGPLGHEPKTIPHETLARAGVEGSGSLAAMMLDTKRTFDEIVHRYAPNEEALERILTNPIYRQLTDALAGSREYSAMEKLHQLHSDGCWDLIVLDTPPSNHALEFLDAPRRLTGFLGSPFLKLLFRPALAMGRTGFRLFWLGSATVLRAFERISGIEFLAAISEFLLAFESMIEGFSSRAREIEALLRDPVCGFVLVAGPDPVQARRAEEFWMRLDKERIHLLGVVLNRVRTWPGAGPAPDWGASALNRATNRLAEILEKQAPAFNPKQTAEGIIRVATRQAALARRDLEIRTQLAQKLPLDNDGICTVPLFDEDVYALEALGRMGRYLFVDDKRE